MGQADPILTRLGAGPAVKKLVETALVLSNSSDPQQRNHAYSFMESAIRELENGENRSADPGLGPNVDDGINAPKLSEEEEGKHDAVGKVFEEEEKDDEEKKEHKINEEVLDNHNNGPREDGSEQSTENTAPYAGEGIDTANGEKPMQDMDDTVNQWSETNGVVVPGMPPVNAMNGGAMNGQMNGNPMDGGAMNGQMNGNPMNGAPNGAMAPGLAPDIAQEMGLNMPPPPDMNTNQMMRQMQYTINSALKNYHTKITRPISERLNATIKTQSETIKEQRNAIKQLSIELRETKTTSGTMKLDLDTMKQNATATFRETEAHLPGFISPAEVQSVTGVQPPPNYQRNKVSIARSEIEQMDKMLNTQKNPMYN